MLYHRMALFVISIALSAQVDCLAAPSPDLGLSTLEYGLFQHANETLPVEQRLAKLEQFVFGRAFADNLGRRSRRLMQAVEMARAEKLGSNYVVSRPLPSSVLLELSLMSKVESLEKRVFARAFTEDSWNTRVSRLEDKVYPRIIVSNDEPRDIRLERLIDGVDDMFAKSPATSPLLEDVVRRQDLAIEVGNSKTASAPNARRVQRSFIRALRSLAVSVASILY